MIELKNINKIYKTGKISFQALHNVNLTIEQGDFVAIMGPSGSGKSTLMHTLGFLDIPDSGSYTIFQKEITSLNEQDLARLRNHLVGFVFQQFHLLSRTTALDNVHLPSIYAGHPNEKSKASARLTDVGLGHRQDHKPNEMSGGEQQRVAIARALVNNPMILFADEPTGNLDTKSEAEIMAILEKLNKEGITIVMVTHEKEIGDRAKRVISMRDGKIVSDTRREAIQKGEWTGHSEQYKDRIEHILHDQASSRAGFPAHFRQAIQAILSNKVRAFLSMLGILIGVAAVIAMLALGEGAKKSIEQRLSSLGSNLLSVRLRSARVQGVSMEGSMMRLTLQDAEAMENLPSVRMVSPEVSGRAQVVHGNKNWNTSLNGVGVNYETMRSSSPVLGRFFTEEELRQRGKVAILGLTVARELFGEENPVGSSIKINRNNFQVIGILPEKGSSGWRDQDDVIIIPISTAMYRVLGENYVEDIDVQVKSAELMDHAQDEIRQLLMQRQKIPEKEKESVNIRNMAEIQETLESTTKTMSWLLGSIAIISLLVGGIGIMNIMLVSVTERTREIGLRKAIGARAEDIMTQFLIESVVMTVAGGLIGIALGFAIAVILSVLAGWATRVSLFSVLLATVFSVGVGMIFGIWPAKQASRLNPIEALRYE